MPVEDCPVAPFASAAAAADDDDFWLSTTAAAHREERGRKMATKVRTWLPSSGTGVVYWSVENIAVQDDQ